MDFSIYDRSNAPEDSKPLLTEGSKKFGFVPKMWGVMAESPALLKTYIEGYDNFISDSDFTAAEQQLIALTISSFNECNYCKATHTSMAKINGLSLKEINAIKNGKELSDSKLNALKNITIEILKSRGFVNEQQTMTFLSFGYTKKHLLEIILAIGIKTMANYVNHLADTPIDLAFRD